MNVLTLETIQSLIAALNLPPTFIGEITLKIRVREGVIVRYGIAEERT